MKKTKCIHFVVIIMSETMQFPWEIYDVEKEEAENLMTYFAGELTGFVRVGPKSYLYPSRFKYDASCLYNVKIRKTDTFLITFPRSGTTWMQELVWLLANDLDYKTASEMQLIERFPYLESSLSVHPRVYQNQIKKLQNDPEKLRMFGKSASSGDVKISSVPSPRFIKSHLPLSLLPSTLLDTAKVIYLARDPRDVVVSCYNFYKIFKFVKFTGDLKTFWNLFINNSSIRTPYFEHVKEAWEKKSHHNMLFVFYEDMSKDLLSVVQRVSNFLGKHYSEKEMASLCEHLRFDNFKNNKSVNSALDALAVREHDSDSNQFIRKGKAGGWQDYFDEEMTQQAEQWIANNLRDTDLKYPQVD